MYLVNKIKNRKYTFQEFKKIENLKNMLCKYTSEEFRKGISEDKNKYIN